MIARAERPWLSLAELERHDPRAPGGRRQRRFCCPLGACAAKPLDAGHRSLSVELQTGMWRCHRCGAAGQLAEYRPPPPPHGQGGTRRSVQSQLHARLHGNAGHHARVDDEPPVAPQRASSDAPSADCAELGGSPGEAYLARRGIPSGVAAAAGVRYARSWAYGRPAVVFPITDSTGRQVARHGRFIDSGTPRMHTPSEDPISSGVFVTPGAFETRRVAICEGPIDALSLAAAGLPSMALIGARIGQARAWLRRALAFREVLIATDADSAGDRVAAELADWLSFGPAPQRLRPPAPCNDWNEVLGVLGAQRLGNVLETGGGHLAGAALSVLAAYEVLYVRICALADASAAARAAGDLAMYERLRDEVAVLTGGPYREAGERVRALLDCLPEDAGTTTGQQHCTA